MQACDYGWRVVFAPCPALSTLEATSLPVIALVYGVVKGVVWRASPRPSFVRSRRRRRLVPYGQLSIPSAAAPPELSFTPTSCITVKRSSVEKVVLTLGIRVRIILLTQRDHRACVS